MSNEPTDQEKYISNLEALFAIIMSKLGNKVEISDDELEMLQKNMMLDVKSTPTGLLIEMVEDV